LRVIVTRPSEQAQAWLSPLRASGLQAQALPLIEIAPAPDEAAVRQARADVPGCSLVMFVSAHAVQHFFCDAFCDAFSNAPASPHTAAAVPALRWPGATLAGSTGAGTSAALRAAGVPPGCIVEPPATARADSEGLWQALQARDWRGAQVLIVRGEQGRDWLAETLSAAGAHVRFVAAYARRPPALTADARALLAGALAQPRGHAWVFSSSEAVQHLTALAPGTSWAASQAVATHPRIAQAVREAGFGRVEEAQGAQLAAVIAALARLQSDSS
jgi:uroporphyrinogen-III synthase